VAADPAASAGLRAPQLAPPSLAGPSTAAPADSASSGGSSWGSSAGGRPSGAAFSMGHRGGGFLPASERAPQPRPRLQEQLKGPQPKGAEQHSGWEQPSSYAADLLSASPAGGPTAPAPAAAAVANGGPDNRESQPAPHAAGDAEASVGPHRSAAPALQPQQQPSGQAAAGSRQGGRRGSFTQAVLLEQPALPAPLLRPILSLGPAPVAAGTLGGAPAAAVGPAVALQV
jgi:hypothetical protein